MERSLLDRSHLDQELRRFKEQMLEMMDLVKSQLELGNEAMLSSDLGCAEEIIMREKRVNALEIALDKEVENLFALYQPVAIDLRFLMASFKINSDLERLGDHAEGIAKYILKLEAPVPKSVLKELRIQEMYEHILGMLTDVFLAYEEEDTKLARKMFKRDKLVNEISNNAVSVISSHIDCKDDNFNSLIYTLILIRKLERCGDLIKNIAEEIIFYVEAKVLKHKKKKK